MTNVKNELPVAVHVASGGDARVRTGGTAISLDGISQGSFQVQNGTKFRVCANFRSGSGAILLLATDSPVTLSNASTVVSDGQLVSDCVPSGTEIYFILVSPMDLQPTPGGAYDYLYVTFYG